MRGCIGAALVILIIERFQNTVMMNKKLISIVIPFRNEASNLSYCLNALGKQTLNKLYFETILADGGSGAKERNDIENSSNILNLKTISNPKKIFSSGANLAIKHADGKYIALLGAHTRLSPNYLKRGLELLSETGAVCVGGRLYILPSETYIGQAISFTLSCPFGIGNSKFRYSNKADFVDTVAYGIYRREVFNKIGLFDETLVRNQDIELNSRLIKAGFKIYYSPEIYAEYRAPHSLFNFIRQAFCNGYWNIPTVFKTNYALSCRHFVPLFFVLNIFLTLPFFLLWLTIVLSYALCSIVFSLNIALKKGFKYLFITPLIFLVLHISYGLGSLISILVLIKKLKLRM